MTSPVTSREKPPVPLSRANFYGKPKQILLQRSVFDEFSFLVRAYFDNLSSGRPLLN